MRLAWLTIVPAVLGLSACHTPPKEPSLLDREFEAYRLDRDERRVDDLKEKEHQARAEAERLERELAALMRRIREAKQGLADARTDGEVRSCGTAAFNSVVPHPLPTTPAPAADPAALPPGTLPAPFHRPPPAAPK